MVSARYVDTDVERARWRFTANYRVLTRLQLGVEFNATVGEANPLATLFIVTETKGRPALFLGTSSDRIGSPEGAQAYFATTSKRIPQLGTTAYASLNYSEWASASCGCGWRSSAWRCTEASDLALTSIRDV